MRDETVRDLKDCGFEASWLRKYLELSGPRGVDYPPPDMTSVHGYRWVLHVTLPEARARVQAPPLALVCPVYDCAFLDRRLERESTRKVTKARKARHRVVRSAWWERSRLVDGATHFAGPHLMCNWLQVPGSSPAGPGSFEPARRTSRSAVCEPLAEVRLRCVPARSARRSSDARRSAAALTPGSCRRRCPRCHPRDAVRTVPSGRCRWAH